MSADEAMTRLSEAVAKATAALTGVIVTLRHHEWDETPPWLCCRCETCGAADSVRCQLPPTQEDFLCDACRSSA